MFSEVTRIYLRLFTVCYFQFDSSQHHGLKKEITDNQLNRNHSKNLFGLDATPTPFVVDGICFGSEDDANGGMDVKKYKEYFAERVNEFIGRIGKYLQ